jgi:hypothetical protein
MGKMVEFHSQTIDLQAKEYPGVDIPTFFADGIINLANSPYILKFYFYRLDPNVRNPQKAEATACAQVVMPMNGFLNMYAFLEKAVETLRAQGVVTEKALDEARKAQAVQPWT